MRKIPGNAKSWGNPDAERTLWCDDYFVAARYAAEKDWPLSYWRWEWDDWGMVLDLPTGA